ncbi:uncharacterized protein EAF02_002849 [Botrytis sinoallii]|uniref:uncharacterized protein n=1 Tax=Botrytis sinoallii TaxID=1463999 RepID=UPI0019005DE4|nr:uncharacterized protein EAF02_002849 [Botrytis sinoallii]KAF7888308.1 hypothetical protein EAF02_002849 [Botrytis sinoallii]
MKTIVLLVSPANNTSLSQTHRIPDLTKFRDARGKLITYHGLCDEIITYKSTEQYHKSVAGISPDIHDFYRYFEVPGKKHCYGAAGGDPTAIFRQLQSWVENGTVPGSSPIDIPVSGETHNAGRVLELPRKFAFESARWGGVHFDQLFNQATPDFNWQSG